jgi:hypothetical protein
MVKGNEIYELRVFPSDWNSIVSQYNNDRKAGRDTILERKIAGESVRCVVTGYSWRDAKKPSAPHKQKILVQII